MSKKKRHKAKHKPLPEGVGSVPAEFADNARGERLQKVMAAAGVASRRECEALILEGRVTVNGERVAALPAWVDPSGDRVEVDGEPIQRTRSKSGRSNVGRLYLMLHKPRRVICTNEDPQGRTRAIDLIDHPAVRSHRARIYPVGRLDADSTGLLLMTNDGEFANRLTHPRYGVTKQYLVAVRGRLDASDVERLRKGIHITTRRPGEQPEARKATFEQVRIVRHETDRTRGDRTTLAITLREGQNREIRRLLARVGMKVRKLKRVAVGPVKLAGVAVGQWRELTPSELSALRKASRQG